MFMFILFVIFPAVLFNGIAKVKKARAKEGGAEIRASELRALIQSAVDEATAGLSARISDLEERLGDEPVHALRERLSGERLGAETIRAGAPAARLDAPALTAAFDPDADLDDADGRPVSRRARA